MDSFNKLYSVIRNTDLLNNEEKIELHLYLFNLNEQVKKQKEVIDKLKEWIYIVQQNKDAKHLEPVISTDELDELLDILKEVE